MKPRQEMREGKGQQDSEKWEVRAKLLLVGEVLPGMLLKHILRRPYAVSQSFCQQPNREELLHKTCCRSGPPLRLHYSRASTGIGHFCTAGRAGIECRVKTIHGKKNRFHPSQSESTLRFQTSLRRPQRASAC